MPCSPRRRPRSQVTQTYKYPIQMHGSMGTSAVDGARRQRAQIATVWSSTQTIYALRSMLATALNFPQQNIHCIYVEGSGCYGQNKADDVALDAAVISQIVGKPVRVAYMRADEHAWENYGQAYTITITARGRHLGPASRGDRLEARRVDVDAAAAGPGRPRTWPRGILMGFPETPLDASRRR